MNKSKRMKSRYSYVFGVPSILFLTVFFFIPIIVGMGLSLVNVLGFDIRAARFAGLSNYKAIFNGTNTVLAIKNSFIFAGITTILKIFFGLLLALALSRTTRITKVLRTVFFIPAIINSVAVGVIFQSLMHPSNGLINAGLKLIGLEGVNWLSDPKIAIYSICIVEVWKWTGYTMVIFLAGLQSISSDYYEAATMDGAKGFTRFRYITFPLLLPTFNNALVISIIGGLKVFDIILVTTGGGPGAATEVFNTLTFKAFASGRLGEGSAVGVLLALCIAAIIIPTYRIISQKEVEA